MEKKYETIDLREIFRIFKKNVVLLLSSLVLFSILGFAATALLITPQYEASATLIVNSKEDQQLQNNVTIDQINSAKQLVNTYAVILTSDTVLNKTIQDLNLNMDYDQLLKKVSITSVNETQVMKISVQDPDPQQARKIVASIMEQAPNMIINTVKAGSVEPISKPNATKEPVSPNYAVNTLVAGMAGLFLAAAVVLIRSLLNNKLMTDEEISQKLNLTVLGVIPQIQMEE